MADKTTPTLRGRRLAGELKKLRERSRLSQAEAARRVGISPSKLSRVEDAKTRATEDDVSALLQMYGLDIDRHPAILKLVEDSWQRGWWTAYGDAFNGSFHMLEDQAPDTANPSLWRQAQLNAKAGLFKVTDRVYQLRGMTSPT